MAQTIAVHATPKKFMILPLSGGMKKLLKSCKHFFFKYEEKQKSKLGFQHTKTLHQMQNFLTQEDRENWLNELLENQQLVTASA